MLLISLLLGLGATALYAAALVAVIWRVGARKGVRWLPLAWLGGGVVYWALSLAKFWLQGMPIHLPPQTSLERLAVFGGLAYGLTGTALLTLSVRKRLIGKGGPSPALPDVGAGVGAFFGGMLLVLAVPAMQDIAALFRRLAP
jgi:hypothetical protein